MLSVASLRKAFGSLPVLRGVDLTVERGQVLAIIGPSGPAKTTLLRCLNGLEIADSSRIGAADGETVDFSARPSRRELDRLRDRSAMVFQHYNLFRHKTVVENVIEGPVVVHGRSRAAAVAEARELLDRVGLGSKDSSHPTSLSGGQQKRVGIVRTLALRPELLLFDEPTSASTRSWSGRSWG